MGDLYFSTGDVARELRLSPERVRQLCQSHAIASELTEGGQLRVSRDELERLKATGLPPLPRRLPGDSPRAGGNPRYGSAALLGEASDALVSAAESVAITEARLKQRRLERELEENEDWFRQRQRDEAEQLAAQERAELERQEAEWLRHAREEDERERESWLAAWEAYSLNSLPSDAPPEVRLTVHEAVRERLHRLQPIPERDVTCKLVDALAAKALAPWRRRKEAERVIQDAVNRLPSGARSYFKPTAWQIQATQAARQAIRQVDQDASLPEIEAAAQQAVEVIAGEFEACRAAQADGDLREHLVRWARFPDGLSEPGKELATTAIREVLAKLPQGTPRPALDRAVEAALEPYCRAIAELQAQAEAERQRIQAEARAEQQRNQAQAQAEQQRNQDRANRQTMIAQLHWAVPLASGGALTSAARAAVAKAVNEAPEGASQSQLDEARDKALAPFLAAHAQQQRKEAVIAGALREIYPCLLRLEESWDFEGQTAWDLARQFTPAIRKQLELELTGQEPPEQVARRVRQLVRKQLETAPAAA